MDKLFGLLPFFTINKDKIHAERSIMDEGSVLREQMAITFISSCVLQRNKDFQTHLA